MRQLCWVIIAAILALFGQNTARAIAGKGPPVRVELICKIRAVGNSWVRKLWTVCIRKSTGELLCSVMARDNESVRFKNLDPGIYVVCISADKTLQRCESVDLMVSDSQRSLRYVKELETPAIHLNEPDLYRVDLSELSIPKAAIEEMRRAEAAEKSGDMQKGIQYLEHVMEICPKCTKALNNLGSYCYHQGQPDRAIECFGRATEIDPGYCVAWMNLASTLLATGQAQAALDASRKAIALSPDDALANVNMALSYFHLREYDQARKYFKRVLDLDPANAVNPQLYLLHMALAERNEAEAEEYVRNFLHFHPNSPKAAFYQSVLDALVAKTIFFAPSK